jgi:uncharacterized surface protein with fasciclin (FAS1) repeats
MDALMREPLRLVSLLKNHVVTRVLLSGDLNALQNVTTASGEVFGVRRAVPGVSPLWIGDSSVVAPDLLADNGVVHGISDVLVTPSRSIVDVLKRLGNFSVLLQAVSALPSSFTALLSGFSASYTLFAPTDAAFSKLPNGTVAGLLRDPARLALVIQQHITAGVRLAADVTAVSSLTMLSNQTAAVSLDGQRVRIGGSMVLSVDN